MSHSNGSTEQANRTGHGSRRRYQPRDCLRVAHDGLDVAVASLPSVREPTNAVVDEVRSAGRQSVAINST